MYMIDILLLILMELVKNKYAFFKNDDNGNNITEVKGEFIINKKNEILLSPSNNKNNKIT